MKPDSALSKALDESFELSADDLAKRLAVLPKILRLATDFKKSKEVVAAGPGAAKVGTRRRPGRFPGCLPASP